jgi:protein involved in polysaccharide export with SLBB domain
MKMRLFASFALLFLVASPAIYSQSSSGTDASDTQQSSSGNCSDSLSVSGEDCTQSQTSSKTSDTGSVRSNAATSSSAAESTTLSGQTKSKTQLQEQLLTPEAPTEFQKFVAATTGQLLPIYGAKLFQNTPSTFSPNDLAPVTSEYVVGPEDELRVRIWGQITYSGNLRVDRSGNIYLPQAGSVHVAGLQFSALDQHLRAAVGKMYRNFDLSVDIGRIRSMQIYVTGQARRPGVYTVSSLSSLVNALFASGGPSAQGSLRHILLKRNGKTITDFDLYALLIQGDKSKDVQLLPEDVLYIPAAGSQVAITGSIRTPGIYEMRSGETINDLIEAAGKTTAISSSERISLERVGENHVRQAMEFSFNAEGLAAPLADGDILRINSIVPTYQKTVTLRGNVANPGRFSFKSGMHVSDLIPDRESLVSRDYWWKRSHLGLPVPEFESVISTIGRDPKTRESTRQGFTTSVSQETLTAALTKNDQQDQSTSKQDLSASNQDLNATKQGQNASSLDLITSKTDSTSTGQTTGSNRSLVADPAQASGSGGAAKTKKNEVRLSAPDINWNYAVIERLDPETLKTSLLPFDLGKLVLNHDASQDLTLQPGDTITIFSQADIRVPLDQQTKYVELGGEVAHAGVYSVQPGETLRDLVRRAGGLTQKAYLYGSEFTRESTRVLQQQRIDEYAQSVSMEAQRGTQALAAASTSTTSSTDVTAAQAAALEMVARLSKIKATGRIVLQFSPDSTGVESVPAISLENGDKFTVPFAPSTVNVVGAVYNQNSFLYLSGKTTNHYLQQAGGANRSADWRRAFVIHADGSVIIRTSVKGLWGNEFAKLRLNAGDTIVMPEKTLRPTTLREVMNWTQMISQLAISGAVVGANL